MKIFNLCKTHIMKYKKKFLCCFLLAIIISIFSAISPYLIGEIINSILNSNLEVMPYLCISYILIVLLKIWLDYIYCLTKTYVQANAGFSLNKFVLEHIGKLPLSFFKGKSSSYLNQRINNDSNELIIFTTESVLSITMNIITISISIFILFSISMVLTFVVVITAIAYVIIYYICKNKIFTTTIIAKEYQATFFSNLQKHISEIKFIKTHCVQDFFEKRLLYSFTEMFDKIFQQKKVLSKSNAYEQGASAIMLIIIILVTAYEIKSGQLDIGFLVITQTYFTLLVSKFQFFLNFYKEIQKQKASFVRIRELLDLKIIENGNICVNNIRNVEFKNVSFHYDDSQLLQNLNFILKNSNIVGIKGKNGVGKSTIISLLLGFHLHEYTGEIYINEQHIEDIDLDDLKALRIGVVEQEPKLIGGTIYENLTLGKEIDNNILNNYVEKLNLNQYQQISEQQKVLVNNELSNLSGGEKQKIAIIRALIKNPDILILDEPTSALDTVTQNTLLEILKNIKKDKIIILISHAKKILNECDYTIEL